MSETRTIVHYREPAIMPVKPGSISEKDRATLRRVGVVVIECDSPADLRLLRPQNELDAGDMLHCALQALVSGKDFDNASAQRQKFTRLIAALVAEKTQPQSETL